MEREKFTLTLKELGNLVSEGYCNANGVDMEFKQVHHEVTGHSRHTALNYAVMQRKSDGKFFGVNYEDSVKDSMGFEECNWGDQHEIVEVFPEQVTTTVYK